MPRAFLLHSARRQLRAIAAEPCIAWLLGSFSEDRVEIINVCRFLSKEGDILKTTDVPYSIEKELGEIRGSLPFGVEPIGCAAVFGDRVYMSILQLVKSLIALSAKARKIYAKAGTDVGSVSGLWCVDELTLHVNGIGSDFENIADQESHFYSSHVLATWTFDAWAPYEAAQPHSIQFDVRLDKSVLKLEDARSATKTLITRDTTSMLKEALGETSKEVICAVYHRPDPKREPDCPHISSKDSRLLFLRFEINAYLGLDWRGHEILERAMSPALKTMLSSFDLVAKDNPDAKEVSSYAFALNGYQFPITAVYPYLHESQADGAGREDYRLKLHRRFVQREDRRLLMVDCAVRHSVRAPKPTKIMNIHEHLPAKKFPEGGLLGVVEGDYEYCHYCHDDFDDSGWGCAYRSLQTVFSWFIHQHYTHVSIPSHKKVQEILIEIGDKEASFYNSREWIGSLEVGKVLEEMIGANFEVVTKAAHQDISSIARRLVTHFRTEGTPVSIGGGVLAYTLLGIYFNDQTAEVELLILDPHYKGRDSIDAILNGGWVAWKKPSDRAAAGGPLFVENTYYNFLCVKRPNKV